MSNNLPSSPGPDHSDSAPSDPSFPGPAGTGPRREFTDGASLPLGAGPGDAVPGGTPGSGSEPVSRGQRAAWNTATGVIGGIGALALLLAGAGAAGAVAMAQERDGTWSAPSEVSSIDVDTYSAGVSVITSPTADRVQVAWQEMGWGLGKTPEPRVSGGTLRLDVPAPRSRWNSSVQQITITVPEKTNPSLDLETTTGAINVNGAYRQVQAVTALGSVSASAVKADVVDARATTGQVLLDGVQVKDRLDAHTRRGLTTVIAEGQAPKRSSVTSEIGAYGISFPAADYWYPAQSQRDFTDPRLPRSHGSGVADDPFPSDDGKPSDTPAATPSATASASPSASPVPSRSRDANAGSATGTAAGYDAKDVCAQAPADRPCLFVMGTPTDVPRDSYLREWRDGWNEYNTDRGVGWREDPTH